MRHIKTAARHRSPGACAQAQRLVYSDGISGERTLAPLEHGV